MYISEWIPSVFVYSSYQDKAALSYSLSTWQRSKFYSHVLSFLGSCHGVWIPGCHRLRCCSFLCTQNTREDLALRQTKHLLGRASRWWEGLRGQGCRGMGKRQWNSSHSLISPGLCGIYKEKSYFDPNWLWNCTCTACSQMNRVTEGLNPA